MTVSEAETSDEGPLSEGGFRRVTQRYDVPFQLEATKFRKQSSPNVFVFNGQLGLRTQLGCQGLIKIDLAQ